MVLLRILVPALLTLAILVSPAHLAPALADRDAAVLAAARAVIVPRLDALALATERQAQAWAAGCADLAALRARYQDAADAWSAVEFVRYGPVMEEDRLERIAHWPDRQNVVARALARLLAADDAVLAPERLMRTSAAGQGLTALERLLYEGAGTGEPRRCEVGRAIAVGLSRTAAQVRDGWRQPGGTLDTLAGSEAERKEAATRLATELLAFVEFVSDQKLGAPMGRDPDLSRPTLAEGWRSGRSLRAIRMNLEGFAALATALADPATPAGSSLAAAATAARAAALEVEGPVGEPANRDRLGRLREALRAVKDLAGPVLAAALDVTLGFNSQDGD